MANAQASGGLCVQAATAVNMIIGTVVRPTTSVRMARDRREPRPFSRQTHMASSLTAPQLHWDTLRRRLPTQEESAHIRQKLGLYDLVTRKR